MHQYTRNTSTRPQLIRPAPNFRAHIALLVTRTLRPQIILPSPSKHISTTTPKVKESPWLSEDSANTDICIDSDRDNREKHLKNSHGSIHIYQGSSLYP